MKKLYVENIFENLFERKFNKKNMEDLHTACSYCLIFEQYGIIPSHRRFDCFNLKRGKIYNMTLVNEINNKVECYPSHDELANFKIEAFKRCLEKNLPKDYTKEDLCQISSTLYLLKNILLFSEDEIVNYVVNTNDKKYFDKFKNLYKASIDVLRDFMSKDIYIDRALNF